MFIIENEIIETINEINMKGLFEKVKHNCVFLKTFYFL